MRASKIGEQRVRLNAGRDSELRKLDDENNRDIMHENTRTGDENERMSIFVGEFI